MNISRANVDAARISQSQGSRGSRPDAAAITGRPAQEAGDRLELSNQGRTPAERVDHFAQTVTQRLSNLARQQGMDLSGVQESFDQHIARIQEGLADGSLSGRDIGQAIASTLDMLREDVREVTGRGSRGSEAGEVDRSEGEDGSEGDPAARVEGFAEGVVDRLRSLIAESDGAVAEGLAGTLEGFNASIDRILAGLEDGSISARDVGAALDNILESTGRDIDRSMAMGRGEGGDEAQRSDGESVAEGRFDDVTSSVLDRLEGIDTSGLDPRAREAFGALAEEFRSAVARLDQAYFEDGSISREQFLELFSGAFSELQDDLAGLFGGDAGEVRLYDAAAGAEQLAGASGARFDATA